MTGEEGAMKRRLAIIMLLAGLWPVATLNAGVLGDINGDGRVDLAEAIYALRIAAGGALEIPLSCAIVGKGDWEVGRSYAECDVIKHNGSYHICVQNHVATETNQPPDPERWAALALKGDPGPPGSSDPMGPLSNLQCNDGQVAQFSGGSWICADYISSSYDKEIWRPRDRPDNGRFKVEIEAVTTGHWDNVFGGDITIPTTVERISGVDRFIPSAPVRSELFIEGPFEGTCDHRDCVGLIGGLFQSNLYQQDVNERSITISNFRFDVTYQPSDSGSAEYIRGQPQPVYMVSEAILNPMDDTVLQWWQDVLEGKTPGPRDIRVELTDTESQIVAYYDFQCVPISFRRVQIFEKATLLCKVTGIVTGRPEIDAWFDATFGIEKGGIYKNVSIYNSDSDGGEDVLLSDAQGGFISGYVFPRFDNTSEDKAKQVVIIQPRYALDRF